LTILDGGGGGGGAKGTEGIVAEGAAGAGGFRQPPAMEAVKRVGKKPKLPPTVEEAGSFGGEVGTKPGKTAKRSAEQAGGGGGGGGVGGSGGGGGGGKKKKAKFEIGRYS